MNTLAVVHHANQFIITDGYDNRDGLSTILDGYEQVLTMHERYRLPANIHFSGTLLEAIAWHRPRFLTTISNLVSRGVVTLIGGTYAENVMPCFSPEFNRAQIVALFDLYEELLNCPARRLTTFWVPERVWDPALASVITDASLPNGGYQSVLLDDRLLFAPGAEREAFDTTGPYFDTPTQGNLGPGDRAYRIVDGLAMLPISAQLRYRIPPRNAADLRWIEEATRARDDALLVYADDLEKTAGVGGWSNDITDYDRFLVWLRDQSTIKPIHLAEVGPANKTAAVDPGTFYELAREWGADDDYSGWVKSAEWAPYCTLFRQAQSALDAAAEDRADRGLLALAHRHLLASTHETAWHDEVDGRRAPAPWARAIAGHVRAVFPIVLAARTMPTIEKPLAYAADIDADGVEEVVLSGPGAMCILAPACGGRLIYLFHEAATGAAMSIGNPTDHFNFQEELNKFMDQPPNHPGGLVDVGSEHAAYNVTGLGTHGDIAIVELSDGALRKTIALGPQRGLVVCYSKARTVETCLSPDYLRLLRQGRNAIARRAGRLWRQVQVGDTSMWLAIDEREATWIDPRSPEAGHGINIAARGVRDHWHMAIGWGPVDDDATVRLLGTAAELHA